MYRTIFREFWTLIKCRTLKGSANLLFFQSRRFNSYIGLLSMKRPTHFAHPSRTFFFPILDLHRPQEVSISHDFLAPETQGIHAHMKKKICENCDENSRHIFHNLNFFLDKKQSILVALFVQKFCSFLYDKKYLKRCPYHMTFLLQKLKRFMRIPQDVRLGHPHIWGALRDQKMLLVKRFSAKSVHTV
jgi:hypothetical protein